MNQRQIIITVYYDVSDIPNNQITPNQLVKEIVEKDMIEHFGWDEGYSGVKVEVNDRY